MSYTYLDIILINPSILPFNATHLLNTIETKIVRKYLFFDKQFGTSIRSIVPREKRKAEDTFSFLKLTVYSAVAIDAGYNRS